MGRLRVLGSGAAALGSAYGAQRLLTPRRGIVRGVPVRAEDHFSVAELRRARRYGRGQLALAAAGGAVELGVLVWLARRAKRSSEEETQPPRHPVIGAAVAGAGLSVGLAAVGLPVSAAARQRSLNAGLATQTWRAWGEDVLKAQAIGGAFAGGGAALAVGLMRRYEDRWWMGAAGGSIAFTVAFSLVGPTLLDPIFNRFTALTEGDTRSDVFALAKAAGVRVRQVYEVDASRRTTAANAYVNGIGPTRRVVLYDTLLESFTRDEARLVVAHELGHVRHRDVPRLLTFAALATPAGAWATAEITRAVGPRSPGPRTLPALTLAMGAVSFAGTFFLNALSREMERRADTFALKLAPVPEAFVSLERRLALQNLADPAPPRWLTALMGTHPAIVERIGIAEAFGAA